MSRVDIGFSEECEPCHLISPQFPSKIGGKPAWLSYKNIPTTEDLQCATCSNPMTFLCQIYAPFEESADNFHRTIFIFICRTPTCTTSTNIKAFRNNLPRKNEYYDYEPPAEQTDFKQNWVSLCELCGCRGDKKCSKCQQVTYCSRQHQVADWSDHKKYCCQNNSHKAPSKHLFDEFEIVNEEEELPIVEVDESEEISKLQQLELEGNAGSLQEADEDELEQHAAFETDKVFARFKKRVGLYPEQVLRYSRGGEALWLADGPLPLDVPNCESCGEVREYELQVMPQILAVLKEEVLDFGVIVVYSCRKSCSGVGYKQEFVFKQDVSAQ